MTTTPTIVRPCGTGALFHTSRHALGICRRVCNTCRYSVPSSTLQSQPLGQIIEDAVATVVMQHGILRVGIVGEESKAPYFSFVESIDLRDMIRWQPLSKSEDQDYDQALLHSLERCHDSLWENLACRPGWEVIVHQPSDTMAQDTVVDITFAFHHAYADGVASKLFHRDLLSALKGAGSRPDELKDHVLHLASQPDLLPGMEAIVPFKISWAYLMRTIWSEIIWQDLVPEWLKSKPSADSIPWTGQAISVQPHHVHTRLLDLQQHTLAGILKVCKEHKTTLTPLLHVLIAVSLSRRLSPETAPAFTTTTPVDLRRCAKPGYDVANNIAGLVSAHDDGFDAATLSGFRSQSGEGLVVLIWQAASSFSARLRKKVATLPNDDIVGMMSWVSDWSEYWTKTFGRKRGATWELSNLGSRSAGSASDGVGNGWRITRSIFTQGALPAGSTFSVNVLGVEGEGLCITLAWQETIVEKELMEHLAADLQEWLEHLGDAGGLSI